MPDEQTTQERTEKATPKRRRDARERGQVARSVELNSFAILFFGMIVLYFAAPAIVRQAGEVMKSSFVNLSFAPLTTSQALSMFARYGTAILTIVAPLMITGAAVGFIVNVAQVGFQPSPKALEPKFDKLNVVKGMKKFVSAKTAVELARDLLKLTVIGTVAYFAARAELDAFITAADTDVITILTMMGMGAFRVGIKIVLALLLIALIDFAYQRFNFEKSIRMTKQEVKEELKHTEGSPLVRQRIRQAQREMARMRMAQEIKTADVVVTNPTTLAVALKYDPDASPAPLVVAKGARLFAEKLKAIAKEHGVPVVENKPLARALFDAVEVGMQIPPELYTAVAEVLAFVYRLSGKAQAEATA